jgi:hypothetical protein
MKFLSLIAFVCLICLSPVFAQPNPTGITGEWVGESKCTVPDSPCHDEHVIYQIAPAKTENDIYSVSAYKVVQNEREFMGTLACQYVPGRATLTCTANTAKHDEWIFFVHENKMTGTLTLDPNKLLYRKITLSRSSRR